MSGPGPLDAHPATDVVEAASQPGAPSTSQADHSAPSSSGDLIRSEERLRVHTVPTTAGRVRLEKYVVTETRTITVEVRHEEIRLVRIPDETPADQMGAAAVDRSALDRWLTLSEERVIVTTEIVPLERVRIEIATVTEQREITDEIRSERIEADLSPQ